MISVIIPVYNASRWLSQCLDSVLSQDYRDLEVILVNDASTDCSSSVCHEYACTDSRVTVVDKSENEGVESARFTGYSKASGEYVMYIDADDWLDNAGVLSGMHRKAVETGADYVETGTRRVLDRHKWIAQEDSGRVRGLIEGEELSGMYDMFFCSIGVMFMRVWGKLYRKSFLDGVEIKASGLIYGEDIVYNLQLLPYLRRVYIMDETGYNYRYGGMCSNYNPRVFRDQKQIYRIKADMLESRGEPAAKARDIIRKDLKETLKSEICQRIEFGGESEKEIVRYLETEIASPLYADMLDVDRHSGFWKDPFVEAFASGDCGGMYRICRKIVRREHPKRMLKRMAAHLIQRL